MTVSALQRSKSHWEELGRLDPCWAILSSRETKFGAWNLKDFFATGEKEIAQLMAETERFRLPKQRSRALDFGCGIGRLTQALAGYFNEAVGVDISNSMITQAREICTRPNCTFVVNAAPVLPFPREEFDLAYSSIVFQHIPDKSLITGYIAELVRVLRPQGLLIMQVPSHIRIRNRIQLRRRLYSWLRSLGVSEQFVYQKLRLHPILMNWVPESEVCRTLLSAGGHLLLSVSDHKAGAHIPSRTYFATKG